MIHNTHMSLWIPPSMCHYVTGTWTDAAGAVAGSIAKSKAAADNTGVISVPINLYQNSIALQGSKLVSVDCWWECLTAAMDAVTAVINKMVLPADTASFAATSAITFTYSIDHDSAAKRLTLEQHKMTLNITTPAFLDDDDLYIVQLTMDAAATSALTFFGCRANFTLRT